jgi:acyl dehydratase
MLSMGMTGKMLTNYVGDGRLRSFGVRFTAQVFPGATLTATATVAAIRDEDGESIADIEVSTVDEAGTVVVKGQATALLDA